jgi:hypothetical protein
MGFGVFVRREIKLRGLTGDEAHGGDRLLHYGDLPPLNPPITGIITAARCRSDESAPWPRISIFC